MTPPDLSVIAGRATKRATVVVIGASEGGVEALGVLAAGLPADLAAAVFVVLHVGAHHSQLPALLSARGPLAACHPGNGDPIRPGCIYVAPPDHHLLLEPGRIRLTRGPRENWTRPAIDPLFRSAADAYGPEVVGVILTGGLNDGAAGLSAVARHGGAAIVQDPEDAFNPAMPSSALRHVAAARRLPLSEIAACVARLVAEGRTVPPEDRTQSTPPRRREMTAEYRQDRPVAVTCPDCGGALRRTETDGLAQFACHIGHVYTAEIMVAAQFAAMEWSLGAAMRALSERAELCRQMQADARAAGDLEAALQWEAAEAEAMARMRVVRGLLEAEWTRAGDPVTPGDRRR